MKKLFTPSLNLFASLILLILITNSCRKDYNANNNPKNLITEAKVYFEQNYSENTPETKANNTTTIDDFQKLGKKVFWDKATEHKISIGDAVRIPIVFEKDYYIKVGKDKSTFSYNDLSYLMMYKDKKGKMRVEWVCAIPDDDYVDRAKEKPSRFSGIVIVKDWNGNILKGYHIQKNGEVYKLESYSSSHNPAKQFSQNSVLAVQCITAESYGDCYGVSWGVVCNHIYNTYCFSYSSSSNSPDNGQSKSSGESDSGGTGDSDYVPDEPIIIKTDCASFAFTKTTTANWQEAGVNNIRLKWVWLGGNYSGISRELFVSNAVFGMPTQYQNPNGSTSYLSAGDAAVRAAILTEEAKNRTYIEFRDHPLLPDDATVINYFRNQLSLLMLTARGTLGFSGSGSSNIIFRDEERSSFFDPYSCN